MSNPGSQSNGMSLRAFALRARAGTLDMCEACTRRPGTGHELAFGLSCREHLSAGPGTQLLWIMRDPGREVGRTGRLCMVHNIADPTSRNALRVLQELGIGKSQPREQLGTVDGVTWLGSLSAVERSRLGSIFATNAVLHGPGSSSSLASALTNCASVLELQVRLLRPRALHAFGSEAATALFRIAGKPRPALPTLWDARPREIAGVPAFFLLHHSPLGVANAKGWGLDPEAIWTRTGAAVRRTLGWA